MGERGEKLYIIRYGQVKVQIPLKDGSRKDVAMLGRGQFIGERTLITGAQALPAAMPGTRAPDRQDHHTEAACCSQVCPGAGGGGGRGLGVCTLNLQVTSLPAPNVSGRVACTGKLRSADCIAVDKVQCVVIHKKDFLEMDNPLLEWMLDYDAVAAVLKVCLAGWWLVNTFKNVLFSV